MFGFRFQARPGMNLIEVLVAAVVAGVVMLALGGYITANLTGNAKEKDRTLANQKALQILEEMSAEDLSDNQLGPDRYAKEGFTYRLTTKDVTPHSPLSGNIQRGTVYKFIRRVDSVPMAGDPLARKVTVKVYYQDGSATTPTPLGKALAVVSGVLRSAVASVGAKQVVDVYAISIENLPHVFRNGSNQISPSTTDARAAFEKSLNAIRLANPGIDFRLQYISRLSVGRDVDYRPYLNEAKPMSGTGREDMSWAYFYPGRVSSASPKRYYDFANMRGQVRINTSGTTLAPTTGYPMADQWNHAVRYHHEFDEANNAPINAVTGALGPNDSPLSLRQLLEEMLQDFQDKYRNAIVVNLHGELFPVIPLRNYADAARDKTDDDPSGKRRVVTHPYKLNFMTGGLGGEHVKLLVHGYTSDGTNDPQNWLAYAKKVRVIIKDVFSDIETTGGGNAAAWDPLDVVVERYFVDFAGGSGNAEWAVGAWPGTRTQVGNDLQLEFVDMQYDAQKVSKGTNTWGIDSGDLGNYGLYRLQYFPDAFLNFLSSPKSGNWRPRNTAKYVIKFPLKTTAARDRYRVITQLERKNGGTPAYATSTSRDPANSHTWFYRGKTWNAALGRYNGIPWTDQVQLVGDPRHMPYLDGRRRGLYNHYHSDFKAGKEVYKEITNTSSSYDKYLNADDRNGDAEWTAAEDLDAGTDVAYSAAYPNTADHWHKTKVDMPAYLAMWREAILRNNAVFVNLSGEPMRYIGLGGEFAFNGPIQDYNVTISKKPWDPSSTSDAGSDGDELFSDNTTLPERVDDLWHAIPWIGDLYPHSQQNNWRLYGNLTYGTDLTLNVKRRRPSDMERWDPFADKTNDFNRKRIDGNVGFATFLNALKSGSTFPLDILESGSSDKGPIEPTGVSAYQHLRMTLPKEARTNYTYKLDGGGTPTGWGVRPPYDTQGVIEWLNAGGAYYKGKTAGEFTVHPLLLTAGSRKAYIVANSFRPENSNDLPNVLQIGATSMLTTFYDATRQSIGANNLKPQPRTKVMKPKTDQTLTGANINLEWYARYIKTDGAPFSPFYAFNPSAAITSGGPLDTVYFVKYRNLTTNGPWTTANFTFAGGASASVDEVAEPTVTAGSIPNVAGVDPYPVTPVVAGPPPYSKMNGVWNIGGLPDGDYLLRVEGFRRTGTYAIPIHYSYHEIPVKIDN